MSKDYYEDTVIKLEEIINKLESGEIELEESLKLYEEGTKLASVCYKKLSDAENKVKKLSKLEDYDVKND